MKIALFRYLLFLGTVVIFMSTQTAFSAPQEQGPQKSDEAVYLDGCLTLTQAVSSLMIEKGAPSSQAHYYHRKMALMCRDRRTTLRAINILNDDLLELTNNK